MDYVKIAHPDHAFACIVKRKEIRFEIYIPLVSSIVYILQLLSSVGDISSYKVKLIELHSYTAAFLIMLPNIYPFRNTQGFNLAQYSHPRVPLLRLTTRPTLIRKLAESLLKLPYMWILQLSLIKRDYIEFPLHVILKSLLINCGANSIYVPWDDANAVLRVCHWWTVVGGGSRGVCEG